MLEYLQNVGNNIGGISTIIKICLWHLAFLRHGIVASKHQQIGHRSIRTPRTLGETKNTSELKHPDTCSPMFSSRDWKITQGSQGKYLKAHFPQSQLNTWCYKELEC